MVNKRLIYPAMGVLVDDVWLSGVQSTETPHSISTNKISDNGRIQSKWVGHSPVDQLEISITRLIGDLSQPFYVPADLSTYNSTFLLANTNIGLSGWDSLKEYKIQVVYGQDDEQYLGYSSTTYESLETFQYCLLTGLSYNIVPNGQVQEVVTLRTKTSSVTNGGLYSGLALPSFPEAANLLRGYNVDLVNTIVPDVVSNLFDNGYNAAEGSNAEDGKYALTGIELSLNIEYGEVPDKGRPRGSVDASKQNLYTYISGTSVQSVFTGLARQESFAQTVSDAYHNPLLQPDEQIKIVSQLGTDYYVWDLGNENYTVDVTENLPSASSSNGEYSVTLNNSRHDFVPYVNTSILTLTQSGDI